jgi:2-polyprenyl-6-methoxyphenol hydroxylase-like FAD-dependent oxidoreductase
MHTRIGDRAVVLGAGMAGLLAARVLADAYAQVTVVDHDALPTDAAPRRRVPQGRHIHVLINRGQQILEELFPGLTAELVAQGAPTLDQLDDVRWYLSGHRLRQAVSGMRVVSASRPCLEGHVRTRVGRLPGVAIADRCEVVGIAATPDRHRVTGVRVRRRADGSAEETIDADLVVDATGRSSRAPACLEGLGYDRPRQEKVVVDLCYVTRTYRLSEHALGGDLGIVIAPTPRHPRGAGLQLIEGNRCVVTLLGILGDHPPTEAEGYLAFARSLQFPDVYDVIRTAELLDQSSPFRFPASVRRRYENLSTFPDGFLVTGRRPVQLQPDLCAGHERRRHGSPHSAPPPAAWHRAEPARLLP